MQIIQLSPTCTIIHGDCLEVIPTLKNKFDAVVTDPPYGINFKQGKNTAINSINHNLKPIHGDDKPFDPSPILELGGTKITMQHAFTAKPIVMFGANHYCQQLPVGEGCWLCWDKSCGQGPNNAYTDAEFIWMNRKSPRCVYRHLWMGAIRAGQDSSSNTKRTHPSMKPVELMAWLIETARIGLGKTVLDPYMGIGSTGVACLQTGRKFVGIEIDEEYFWIAHDRLKKELEYQAGQLFNQDVCCDTEEEVTEGA